MKYLYFSAPWCGPCRMLGPKMEQVAESVEVEKINIDDNIELVKKFSIRNVPTVILVDSDENQIERFVGVNTIDFFLDKFKEHSEK